VLLFTKIRLPLLIITLLFLSVFAPVVTAEGNDHKGSLKGQQLSTLEGEEKGETIGEGGEAAALEGEKSNDESGKTEENDSEQYSDFPKNFIIPRGTCDPRPPAKVFSE
jgi:hypothetical protein